MEIVIKPDGKLRCIYGESIDLTTLGRADIRRGSHVEPTEEGSWSVDLSPANGPCLGPFKHRSEALRAEIAWLSKHWLVPDLVRHSKE